MTTSTPSIPSLIVVDDVAVASSSSAPRPTSPPSSSAGLILALPPSVVNRIAAGEVIHRPSNALKELLENAIDAEATQIKINITNGGLNAMQIQDNGTGIRLADFPLLCERFATSKLRDYSDLSSMSTFGFRGEALASMTFVARVTVTSKTESAECAWKAAYEEGVMVEPTDAKKSTAASSSSSSTTIAPPASIVQPKPCAGVRGTLILVEHLFHNVLIRRRTLESSTSEEYARCLDMLSRYATHYSGRVSITCRKSAAPGGGAGAASGAAKVDLLTPLNASLTENIRLIWGAALAKELLALKSELSALDCSARKMDSARYMRLSGMVSNANYSVKKLTFILFINDRLVESAAVKKRLEGVYAKYLPKSSHPFVYLALELDPSILDVNVHPTKKEVHFLHEDQILDWIETQLEHALRGANQSRVFTLAKIGSNPNVAMQAQGSVAPMSIVGRAGVTMIPIPGAAGAGLGMMSAVRGIPSSSTATAMATNVHDVSDDDAMQIDQMDGSQHMRTSSQSSSSQSRPFPSSSSSDFARGNMSQTGMSSSFPSVSYAGGGGGAGGSGGGNMFSALRMPSSSGSAPSQQLSQQSSQQPRRDDKLVRTDNKQGRIDSFLTQSQRYDAQRDERQDERGGRDEQYDDDEPMDSSSSSRKRTHVSMHDPPSAHSSSSSSSSSAAANPTIKLTSVLSLLSSISSASSPQSAELFHGHVFVGVVSARHALVQFRTGLFLVDSTSVSKSFFYEAALRKFGHAATVKFAREVPIARMVRVALGRQRRIEQRSRGGGRAGGGDVAMDGANDDATANEYAALLLSHASMLREYFAIDIVAGTSSSSSSSFDSAYLVGLPDLLSNYTPPLLLIPMFLLSLARADFTAECACFHAVASSISELFKVQDAKYYMQTDGVKKDGREEEKEATSSSPSPSPTSAHLYRVIQHSLYPALHSRSSFTPPASALTDGSTITQIASLENLYKIFERC